MIFLLTSQNYDFYFQLSFPNKVYLFHLITQCGSHNDCEIEACLIARTILTRIGAGDRKATKEDQNKYLLILKNYNRGAKHIFKIVILRENWHKDRAKKFYYLPWHSLFIKRKKGRKKTIVFFYNYQTMDVFKFFYSTRKLVLNFCCFSFSFPHLSLLENK